MPSLDDIYNQIASTNTNLKLIHNDVAPLNSDLQTIHNDLVHLHSDLQIVINLNNYTNQALYHHSQQNDTIICILEKLSRITCEMRNEADLQTKYQSSISDDIRLLVNMYKLDHSKTYSLLEREEHLKKEIEKCCPPVVEPPPCMYEPCGAPQELPPPPKLREENPIR